MAGHFALTRPKLENFIQTTLYVALDRETLNGKERQNLLKFNSQLFIAPNRLQSADVNDREKNTCMREDIK